MPRHLTRTLAPVGLAVLALSVFGPVACGVGTQSAGAQVRAGSSSSSSAKDSAGGQSSLQSAADRAGRTAQSVAMRVIGIALAVGAAVLVFKRDFREAAALVAVGIVAVVLATPDGISLLQDTAHFLFGA